MDDQLIGESQTISMIQSFFLAMVVHPEAQVKAQAELDRVCPNRLPEFDDIDSLPYIEAIRREVLRWNPVAPEGQSLDWLNFGEQSRQTSTEGEKMRIGVLHRRVSDRRKRDDIPCSLEVVRQVRKFGLFLSAATDQPSMRKPVSETGIGTG